MTASTAVERTGIVYVLTNPAMQGLVKIGWTSRTAEARAAELDTTGVPAPFEVQAAFRVPDGRRVEHALHEAFRPWRYRNSREFFEVEPYQVRAILRLLGEEAGAEDVTEEVEQEPSLIPNEVIVRRPPRPRADFQVMRIPVGSEILSKRNEARAYVASSKTVIFGGEEMSLTAATRLAMPDVRSNAYGYWLYGEETLWNIYERYYPR